MDTNEPGREPTDAELLRFRAEMDRLRMECAANHSEFDEYNLACIADSNAHKAVMCRGREYLSGQRPMPPVNSDRNILKNIASWANQGVTITAMPGGAFVDDAGNLSGICVTGFPDAPAPDEVAQPPEWAGVYKASDIENLLRDTERVLKYLRWDGKMAEKHEIRMIGKAIEVGEFTVARKLVREMIEDRKRLTARIDDLERENAALRAERDGHRGLVNRLQRVRIAAFHLVDNAQEHLDNTGATIFDPWYSDLCDALDEYEAAVSAGKEAPDAE